jgi:hypothetical protein
MEEYVNANISEEQNEKRIINEIFDLIQPTLSLASNSTSLTLNGNNSDLTLYGGVLLQYPYPLIVQLYECLLQTCFDSEGTSLRKKVINIRHLEGMMASSRDRNNIFQVMSYFRIQYDIPNILHDLG